MTYSLTRHPFPPAVRRLHLASREILGVSAAPDHRFLRLRLAQSSSGEFDGFVSPGGGDHVRVVVGPPDGGEVPFDAEGAPVGDAKTETVVAHEVAQGWIDLDVLVHGHPGSEVGVMGAWAARAPLGAPAVMMGPKGSVVLTGDPGEVVLAGDDSAIPAVRRYLRMLGSSITGHLLLETRFDLAHLGVVPPAGLRVSILDPDEARPSAALAAALQALPAPERPRERFVFACGEQSLVAPARALLGDWGIDVERAVVKGYWRR